MSELLKGNFKTQRPVAESEVTKAKEDESIAGKLRKKALASLGGSMVYMERTDLMWDGDRDADKKQR